MVINAASVRSTIYIINIYNILSVCVRGCMKAGKTFAELGTKKRFPIVATCFFGIVILHYRLFYVNICVITYFICE